MKEYFNNLSDSTKLLIAVFVVGVGLVLLMMVFNSGISYFGNKRIERIQGNFNANQTAQTVQVGNANANIAELEKQDAAVNANVEIRREQLNEARNEVIDAQVNTNTAISTADTIRNSNYNGTGRDAANKARCRAYPNSKGC